MCCVVCCVGGFVDDYSVGWMAECGEVAGSVSDGYGGRIILGVVVGGGSGRTVVC